MNSLSPSLNDAHLAVVLLLLLAGGSDLGEVRDDLLGVLRLSSTRLTAAEESFIKIILLKL